MNFPNLAIVQTSISRRPIDKLKLSSHSKPPLFQVSCKNRGKKPITLWSKKMKIWFLFARRISHRAFGVRKLLQWKQAVFGKNLFYPKNKLMRLLLPNVKARNFLACDRRTPGTLNNQQLSPVLLLALERSHWTLGICPASPSILFGTNQTYRTRFNASMTLSAVQELVQRNLVVSSPYTRPPFTPPLSS